MHRKLIIIKLSVIYALLAVNYAKGKRYELKKYILDSIKKLLDYYIIRKDEKELMMMFKVIKKIEKEVLDNQIVISNAIILNFLDQIIEDEKIRVKFQDKLVQLNKLQDIILADSDYMEIDLQGLNKAEDIGLMITKVYEDIIK